MQLLILAKEEQKEELLAGGVADDCKIDWITIPAGLPAFTNYDAIFDLLFEENGHTIHYLNENADTPVFINSVNKTIEELEAPFIRINGWPGFLKRPIAEVAGSNEKKKDAEKILNALNKKAEWIPDIKGFVSARVICMIINEAYFALEENVSTKEEIDIAMKLGTNYPYGPFEWAKKIGLKKIAGLLSELSKSEKRYHPSQLLLKEAGE
jgi:3-hydroxybutyryl-CoA dehydrogenase